MEIENHHRQVSFNDQVKYWHFEQKDIIYQDKPMVYEERGMMCEEMEKKGILR